MNEWAEKEVDENEEKKMAALELRNQEQRDPVTSLSKSYFVKDDGL